MKNYFALPIAMVSLDALAEDRCPPQPIEIAPVHCHNCTVVQHIHKGPATYHQEGDPAAFPFGKQPLAKKP